MRQGIAANWPMSAGPELMYYCRGEGGVILSTWHYTPYALLAIIGAVACSSAALAAWRRRPAPGAAAFAVFLLSAAEWSLSFAFQLSSAVIEVQQFWYKIEWICVMTAASAFVIFTIQFTSRARLLKPPTYIFLSLMAILVWTLIWTNDLHQLMWKPSNLPSPVRDFSLLGPGFWGTRVYIYAIFSAGLFFLLTTFLASPRLYRRQLLPLMIGIMLPFVGDLLAGVLPDLVGGASLTSLALSLGALIGARGFLGHGLMGIVPIARDAVIKNMHDAVIVLDPQLTVVDVNPAAEQLLDQPAEDLLGLPADTVFAQHHEIVEQFPGFGEGRAEVVFAQTQRTYDCSLSNLRNKKGNTSGRLLVFHEITDRKAIEAALRESEERYALAARGANDGLWDWNLENNQVHYSLRWKAMLGFEAEEIGSLPTEWLSRIHPADLDAVQQAIADHLDGVTPNFENEHRLRTRDGSYTWVLARALAPRSGEGKPQRMAGSISDITERKRAEQQLLHVALHDGLTSLPNREFMIEQIKVAIERSKRKRSYQFAVLFLDLDRFKIINDSLGHMVGDQLLIAVARRLCTCLRQQDTFARVGGDEFVALLEDLDGLSDAVLVAERIQRTLEERFDINCAEIHTSASIGIAIGHAGYNLPDELLRDADIAMYSAKELGRSRYAIFDDEMHKTAVTIQEIESQLHRAIQRDEFSLHYQPIYDLRDGMITHLEALLRWNHPARGQLLPGDFLGIAEKSDLIVPLGNWGLRQACQRIAVWHADYARNPQLGVSVNFSQRQLCHQNLLADLQQSLDETTVDPALLSIEISESVITTDNSLARKHLEEARQMGVQIVIDDFGSGQSSLSILHAHPIDIIKLDQSLLQGLKSDERKTEIVRAIINLGHNLNKRVIANGIDLLENLDLVREMGCDFGQGFIFSAPMEPQLVTAYLRKEQRSARRQLSSRWQQPI